MAWVPFQHMDAYECHTSPLHPPLFWPLGGLPGVSGTSVPLRPLEGEGVDKRKMKQREKTAEFKSLEVQPLQQKQWLGLKRNTIKFTSVRNDEASALAHPQGYQRPLR